MRSMTINTVLLLIDWTLALFDLFAVFSDLLYQPLFDLFTFYPRLAAWLHDCMICTIVWFSRLYGADRRESRGLHGQHRAIRRYGCRGLRPMPTSWRECVHPPRISRIKHQTSNNTHRKSNVKHQTSNVNHLSSNIKHQTSNVTHQKPNNYHQTSNVKPQTSNDRHQTSQSDIIKKTKRTNIMQK